MRNMDDLLNDFKNKHSDLLEKLKEIKTSVDVSPQEKQVLKTLQELAAPIRRELTNFYVNARLDEKNELTKKAHLLLIKLAELVPINLEDPFSQEKPDPNFCVYSSEGQPYDVKELATFHNQRQYNNKALGEQSNSRFLLNENNYPFSLEDRAHILNTAKQITTQIDKRAVDTVIKSIEIRIKKLNLKLEKFRKNAQIEEKYFIKWESDSFVDNFFVHAQFTRVRKALEALKDTDEPIATIKKNFLNLKKSIQWHKERKEELIKRKIKFSQLKEETPEEKIFFAISQGVKIGILPAELKTFTSDIKFTCQFIKDSITFKECNTRIIIKALLLLHSLQTEFPEQIDLLKNKLKVPLYQLVRCSSYLYSFILKNVNDLIILKEGTTINGVHFNIPIRPISQLKSSVLPYFFEKGISAHDLLNIFFTINFSSFTKLRSEEQIIVLKNKRIFHQAALNNISLDYIFSHERSLQQELINHLPQILLLLSKIPEMDFEKLKEFSLEQRLAIYNSAEHICFFVKSYALSIKQLKSFSYTQLEEPIGSLAFSSQLDKVKGTCIHFIDMKNKLLQYEDYHDAVIAFANANVDSIALVALPMPFLVEILHYWRQVIMLLPYLIALDRWNSYAEDFRFKCYQQMEFLVKLFKVGKIRNIIFFEILGETIQDELFDNLPSITFLAEHIFEFDVYVKFEKTFRVATASNLELLISLAKSFKVSLKTFLHQLEQNKILLLIEKNTNAFELAKKLSFTEIKYMVLEDLQVILNDLTSPASQKIIFTAKIKEFSEKFRTAGSDNKEQDCIYSLIKPLEENQTISIIDEVRLELKKAFITAQISGNRSLIKISHYALIILAEVAPLNTPELAKIKPEKQIAISSGHKFDLELFVKKHQERKLQSGEESENKKFLRHPITDEVLSLEDTQHIIDSLKQYNTLHSTQIELILETPPQFLTTIALIKKGIDFGIIDKKLKSMVENQIFILPFVTNCHDKKFSILKIIDALHRAHHLKTSCAEKIEILEKNKITFIMLTTLISESQKLLIENIDFVLKFIQLHQQKFSFDQLLTTETLQNLNAISKLMETFQVDLTSILSFPLRMMLYQNIDKLTAFATENSLTFQQLQEFNSEKELHLLLVSLKDITEISSKDYKSFIMDNIKKLITLLSFLNVPFSEFVFLNPLRLKLLVDFYQEAVSLFSRQKIDFKKLQELPEENLELLFKIPGTEKALEIIEAIIETNPIMQFSSDFNLFKPAKFITPTQFLESLNALLNIVLSPPEYIQIIDIDNLIEEILKIAQENNLKPTEIKKLIRLTYIERFNTKENIKTFIEAYSNHASTIYLPKLKAYLDFALFLQKKGYGDFYQNLRDADFTYILQDPKLQNAKLTKQNIAAISAFIKLYPLCKQHCSFQKAMLTYLDTLSLSPDHEQLRSQLKLQINTNYKTFFSFSLPLTRQVEQFDIPTELKAIADFSTLLFIRGAYHNGLFPIEWFTPIDAMEIQQEKSFEM